jgi:hypothetical protein
MHACPAYRQKTCDQLCPPASARSSTKKGPPQTSSQSEKITEPRRTP